MLLKQNIILAWKNIKARKKQTGRVILLCSMAIIIFCMITLLEKGMEKYVEYFTKDTLDCRILKSGMGNLKPLQESYEYYKNDERVLDAVISKEGRDALLVNGQELTDEITQSTDAQGVCIEVYQKGVGEYTDYRKTLKKNEVLIPKYFNPDLKQGADSLSGAYTYKMKLVDTSSWVGKEIVVQQSVLTADGMGNEEVSEEKKEFLLKVVGTYDNIKMCEYDNYVYVGKETVNSMYEACQDEFHKKSDWGDNVELVVVAKDYEDVEQLEKESTLERITYGRDDDVLYEFFMNGLKFAAIVLFVAAIVNIVLSMTEEIRERRSEIALLRAVGYANENIAGMLLCELVGIIGVICVIVIVACNICVVLGNRLIQRFAGTLYCAVTMEYDAGFIGRVLMVCVVAMLMTFVSTYYKMEQVNTVEALKEE